MMGTIILKLTDEHTNFDYYIEWSSVIDAPISVGMDIESFKKYYLEKYGTVEKQNICELLKRVDKSGTSSRFETLPETLSFNRAGKNETTLSKNKLIQHYCIEKNLWREYD